MKKFTFFSVFIALSMLWPQINLNGQGTWIEQPTDPAVSNHLFNRGDDCLGYAKENSQYIYFFDINAHQWTTADLGSEQVIHKIEGHGKVIMAYTDELIIAYSSLTSAFDTLHYQGELINPFDPGVSRGFGCADKMAYFVTEDHFYVFDGELGYWKSYGYTLPLPFQNNTAEFINGNDYIGVVLPENNATSNYVINMAYSLPQHEFAYTGQGGYASFLSNQGVTMAYGFVTRNNHWNENVVEIGGYSALTNQFTVKTVLLPEFIDLNQGNYIDPGSVGEITAATYIYTDGESQTIYAYSTLLGSWTQTDLYYNPDMQTPFHTFRMGGSIGATMQYNLDSYAVNYLYYNSIDGGFHSISAVSNGLSAIGNLAIPDCGGKIIMASDSTKVWFYNSLSQSSHSEQGFAPAIFPIYGDNFMAVTTWDLSMENTDILYIFNAQTNHTTAIDLGFTNMNFFPESNPDMFAFAYGPTTSDVYLYSAVVDDFTHIPLAPNSYANIEINNHLAIIQSQNQNYFYNGNINLIATIPYNFDFYALGDSIAIFAVDEFTSAYNFNEMDYSTIQINGSIGGVWATGNIGLATNIAKSEYYAYNGYSSNWVTLFPEGDATPFAFATDKTALVVRNDRIYAFDPEIVTGIEEQNGPKDALGFELMQNHPNPFKGYTRIAFTLTQPGKVSLKIYDMRGNEIADLINEYKTKGEYHLQYDAGKLPQGVYYYTLKFNNQIQSKRMVVIK